MVRSTGRVVVLLAVFAAGGCETAGVSPVEVNTETIQKLQANRQLVEGDRSHRSISTLFSEIASELPTFAGVYVSSPGVLAARFTDDSVPADAASIIRTALASFRSPLANASINSNVPIGDLRTF